MVETWSLVVATATLTASVIGFGVLRFIEFQRDRDLAQRAAVSRVLDTVERASRVLATSSISGIWTNHVFELTQLLPRLLLELDRRDQAIAVWVYREIQTLVLTKDRRQSARIIQGIGYTLTEWKNGQKSRAWFAKDLASNPPVDPFVVPKSTLVKLNTRPLLTLLTLPVFAGFALGVGYRASAFVSRDLS
jgi:hypothetical protein